MPNIDDRYKDGLLNKLDSSYFMPKSVLRYICLDVIHSMGAMNHLPNKNPYDELILPKTAVAPIEVKGLPKIIVLMRF